MWKLFSMLFLAGAAGAMTADVASACGGGGGCGSMGGGRGRYGGGRSVASSKVLSGGPRVARSAAPAARTNAPRVAASRSATPATTVANTKARTSAAIAPLYTCPMHPQVQWTKPTDCPICGMKLKLKQAAPDTDGAGADSEAMNDMPGMGGMDDMMMCPGCMMNMGGMPGMGGGKQAPPASRKAGGATRGMAGMGCGC